jgi:ATP-binding cassette subfamily B protein
MTANIGEMYVFATFRPIIDFLASFSLAIILYFGAARHFSGALSIGVLVAFINLIRRFYQPVMDISEKYTFLQSAMAGIERVFQILDDPRQIPDTGKKTLPEPRGRVEFSHVSFSYKAGEPVLRDLNLLIEPGKTAAIVGYTGAGKTTVANLLTRLWDIDSGNIFLDGIDIRDLPLSRLRSHIQPIQQDIFLFNQSLRENIILGLDLPEEKIVEAAKAAQLHDFIMTLPEGYETLVHEGAVNLSTGQRQLISFARIFAHDPPVLILDEATSSIDTETEKLIQKALSNLLRGRTALVIAHRLSTIRDADKIFVFSGGRAVEEGSHEELFKKRGIYHALYRLQCDYCDDE